ncbi:MAG TPA: cytochrome P450, partial [Solirubrobacteraceae bacterium]
ARLRTAEPVSWVPALDGWLITRHDLAIAVMGDAAHFTVDDPRFSTAQVIGPSMLSLDGQEHAHHRLPFVAPFRPVAVSRDLTEPVRNQVARLIDELRPRGGMELRRQFAGPLAAGVIAHALGLGQDEIGNLLDRYDAIVASVTSISAGQGPTREGAEAFSALRDRLDRAVSPSLLTADQVAANAAVLLFGGIETTEGMISNAALELLKEPAWLDLIRQNTTAVDAALDESLRLEPAAAVIDRYATTDRLLGGAEIARGELVRISITAANRDPAVFADPDRFNPARPNLRRHLAFAQGPHVCLGVHLARLEARLALGGLIERLPGLRLHPDEQPRVEGLVFRKPRRLAVQWDA